MTPLTPPRLRAHPELAVLVALAAQLELVEVVFATVHGPPERPALADQARSMTRVSRVLAHQIRAYTDLVDVAPTEPARRAR